MSITPQRAALAVPLLVVGLALSACGVSDDQLRAGSVAADVDGAQITLTQVDDSTSAVCTYLASGAVPDFMPYPRYLARRGFATALVQEAALKRIVDERGLTLPDSYADTVRDIEAQFADTQGDDRDELVSTGATNAYVTAAATALGDAELEAEGGTAATPEESVTRGLAAVTTWLQDHDVSLNPVLGLALTDEGITPTDDALSVAVSDEAVAGIVDVEDPAVQDKIATLVRTLPPEQVCGA